MYALFKKEVNAFLSSIIGYVAIIVYLSATGSFMFVFSVFGTIFDRGESSLHLFFQLSPIVFMLLIPALTMRLFAEENRTGTIELLLTKPLTDSQIILSKYFAAVFLFILCLIPTLIYYVSIIKMGEGLDHASTWGGYIGLLLLGGAFISIGVFASAITKNQVISFILAILLCFIFYCGLFFLSDIIYTPLDYVVLKLSIYEHYESIQRGVIDSRDIIYFISLTLLFLMITRFILQSRKW